MSVVAFQPAKIKDINDYLWWFDKAHQHFLLLRNGTFSVWSPNTNDEKSGIPLLFYHDHLILPKNILLAKISLDFQLISAQITATRVMVFDKANHNHWVIDIKSPVDNKILSEGMVWSEHNGNSQDLIIVTMRGLEMYKISSVRNQCKLSRTISQGVSYHSSFWYEPNHRMMLLASPMKVQSDGDASSSGGRIRRPSNPSLSLSSTSTSDNSQVLLVLNGYFFRSEKTDFLPKLELPPPDKSPRFELGPGILPRDISLVTLYGNLYCAVSYTFDFSGYIALYVVTKTAVMHTHTLSQHSPTNGGGLTILISVSDNLLYAHCLESKTTLIFDILHRSSGAGGGHAVVDHIESVAPAGAILLQQSNCPWSAPPAEAGAGSSSPVGSSRSDGDDCGWDAVGEVANHTLSPAAQQPNSNENASLTHSNMTVQLDVYELQSSFIFLPPQWLWDSKSGELRKIRAVLTSISQSIHDPKQCITFLARRGQFVKCTKPVYSSHLEDRDSLEAKRLILQRCSAALLSRVGLSWLEVIFKTVIAPYAEELARINALAKRSEIGSIKDATVKRERSSSKASRPKLSGSHKARDSFDRAVEFDLDNSMVARGISVINTVVKDARKTLGEYYAALDPGDRTEAEALEPNHALYLLLPDITTVGTKDKIRHGHQLPTSSYTPSSPPVPLAIRRDADGNLVLTQTEMLSHVWIPILLATTSAIDLEYYSWALSSFIATQRGEGVNTHPAVSMLLLKLLSARQKYTEIARLLQLQFFPDAPEVAMTALEISDIIEESLSTFGQHRSMEDSRSGSPGTNNTSYAPSGHHPSLLLRSAVMISQQVGLDMLWRLNERCVVVRWLLGHGRINDAMSLCRKKKGSWRPSLSPGSIPGADFYLSALAAIQATIECDGGNVDDDSDEGNDRDVYTMGSAKRVEVLHSVYRFLQEWDPEILAVNEKSQRSRLALQAAFPSHMFEESAAKKFRELFGYAA